MDNKLIIFRKKNIFYKIRHIFSNLANKKNTFESVNKIQSEKTKDNIFTSNIEIINLQKEYRSGNLEVEKLSSEQVLRMCKLYDKQILDLKRLNESQKKKIIKYGRAMTNK
ncbi:MAG: hypothetical protein E7314_04525 [Clostridiales bacterium]|nr:hypothetical protein [Clostridiales bacterium]